MKYINFYPKKGSKLHDPCAAVQLPDSRVPSATWSRKYDGGTILKNIKFKTSKLPVRLT